MAATPVVGTGPVTFTDASSGQQFCVPLTALGFDDGKIASTAWAGPAGFTTEQRALLDAYLGRLVSAGALVPGESPPPAAAMVFKAKQAGASGNRIQIAISNVRESPPGSGTILFDLAIIQTDAYAGLSVDSASARHVKAVLGTETKAGTDAGLARTRDADDVKLLPKNGAYSFTGGSDTDRSAAAIDANDGSGTAYTLDAWAAGASGDLTKVTVSNAGPATDPKAFDLQVVWTQSFAALKTSTIDATLARNFLVEVSKPAGAEYAVPSPGTILLSGGADASDAAQAGGTLMAV